MGLIRDRWRTYADQQLLTRLQALGLDLGGVSPEDLAHLQEKATAATDAELAAAIASIQLPDDLVREPDLLAAIEGVGVLQGAPGPEGPQGPAGPAGPVGLTFRGLWSAGATYVVDDLVTYGGSGYYCHTPPPVGSVPVVDAQGHGAYWELLVLQGAPGERGPAGASGGGALGGKLTAAINASQTTIPATLSAEWPTGAVTGRILVDSELMAVTNIALAGGVWTLTVVRGQLGTAAATHKNNAVVWARTPFGGGGSGLPTGGATGAVLIKNSPADGDAGWSPLSGGGTRHWMRDATDLSSGTMPVGQTLVPGMTVTVPASTVARTAFVSWIAAFTGGHTNRFEVWLDGVSASGIVVGFIDGTGNPYSGTMVNFPVSLPADNAPHTIEVRCAPSDSTVAVTWTERWLNVDVYEGSGSTLSLGRGATGPQGPAGLDGTIGWSPQVEAALEEYAAGFLTEDHDPTFTEDGKSLTNWTVVAGTWAVDAAGYIKQTDAAQVYRGLRFNQRVPVEGGVVMEADVAISGAAAAIRAFLGPATDASIAGHAAWGGLDKTGPAVQRGIQQIWFPGGVPPVLGTFYRVRVVYLGMLVTLSINGVPLGSYVNHQAQDGRFDYPMLVTYGGEARFKNIRIWQVDPLARGPRGVPGPTGAAGATIVGGGIAIGSAQPVDPIATPIWIKTS